MRVPPEKGTGCPGYALRGVGGCEIHACNHLNEDEADAANQRWRWPNRLGSSSPSTNSSCGASVILLDHLAELTSRPLATDDLLEPAKAPATPSDGRMAASAFAYNPPLVCRSIRRELTITGPERSHLLAAHVLRWCYTCAMRTITHRQLRNESGAVLRDVAAGESMLVTNNGSVVARISPASETEPELPVTRAATARGFDAVPLYDRPGNVLDALADLRGDR